MKNTKSLSDLIVLAIVVFNNEKFKDVKIVYAAEDGNVFVEENRARLHVKGTDLKFHPITRIEAGVDRNDNAGNEVNEELLAERIKELQGLDISEAKYDQLKALTLFFDLTVENMKAPTLVAALTEYKSKIAV